MEKRFLNIVELSQYLSVKENTIYSWVSQRKIPFKKLGRLVRFSLEEIDEWIKQKSVVTYCKY